MKWRWVAVLLILFIGFNVCISDQAFRGYVAQNLDFALFYYKDRVKHYYLTLTGQVHQPIITMKPHHLDIFDIVCDAWLLESKQSEPLRNAFDLTFIEIMKEKEESYKEQNLRKLDDWLVFFQQDITLCAAHFKEKTSSQITDADWITMSKILANPPFYPDPALRALRYINTKKEQRESLKPFAKKLVLALDTRAPWMAIEPQSPEAHTVYQEAKDLFIAKAESILKPHQIMIWRKRTEQVQGELDSLFEQIRKWREEEKLREQQNVKIAFHEESLTP